MACGRCGGYSSAKRAVAALTWQIGRQTPPGVTVNAMSPIANTRMVAAALERARAAGRAGGGGGLSLNAIPGPENLGPLGAHLVSDGFGWCSGQVLFAGGSEVAVVDRPRLLEVVRTDEVASLGAVLQAVLPRAFAKAEAAQATDGGSNPRFGPIFDEPAPAEEPPEQVPVASCDRQRPPDSGGRHHGRPRVPRGSPASRSTWRPTSTGPPRHCTALPLPSMPSSSLPPATHPLRPLMQDGRTCWRTTVGSSSACTPTLRGPGLPEYSARTSRPIRLVTLTDATTPSGRSQAQASAQQARVAAGATKGLVTAFALSVEAPEEIVGQAAGELVSQLLCNADAAPLAGAELAVSGGWVGLRSHPRVVGAVTYGGPAVPSWLDVALRDIAPHAGDSSETEDR